MSLFPARNTISPLSFFRHHSQIHTCLQSHSHTDEVNVWDKQSERQQTVCIAPIKVTSWGNGGLWPCGLLGFVCGSRFISSLGLTGCFCCLVPCCSDSAHQGVKEQRTEVWEVLLSRFSLMQYFFSLLSNVK